MAFRGRLPKLLDPKPARPQTLPPMDNCRNPNTLRRGCMFEAKHTAGLKEGNTQPDLKKEITKSHFALEL